MSKRVKEVGNKKHNFRKAFWIIGGVIVLAAGAVSALVATSVSPLLVLLESALLVGGVGAGIEIGATINKLQERSKVKKNKKIAKKALEEIRKLDNNPLKRSESYRAKVVAKYAKANLVLAKVLGSSSFGVFHSNSGRRTERETELINLMDNYALLRDSAETTKEQKKYAKKFHLTQQKLMKYSEDEVIVAPYKWSRTYDDVLAGVSVVDRRTEISCLSEGSRDKFISMFESSKEKTDKKALNIVCHFGASASVKTTYAKSEDQTKEPQIREIMLEDIANACMGKTPAEVRKYFPIVYQSKIIHKENTNVLKENIITIKTLRDLKNELDKCKGTSK